MKCPECGKNMVHAEGIEWFCIDADCPTKSEEAKAKRFELVIRRFNEHAIWKAKELLQRNGYVVMEVERYPVDFNAVSSVKVDDSNIEVDDSMTLLRSVP